MKWITVPEEGLSLRDVRRLTERSVNLSAEVEASVSAILKDVRENGDAAVRALTEKFDGVTLSDFRVTEEEIEEALPLIRRFYRLGFNIEATAGTATFLKENGIRTHVLGKIRDGSDEIPNALRQGHIAYVINTRDPGSSGRDGTKIRRIATEHNVTLFTALDTIRVLLDVLEETTLTISTIDA